MMNRKVLLVAGGGTIGTYTCEELLNQGHFVDVICLEDKKSDNEKLKFYKENVTDEFLAEFLKDKHYDAIVNYMHYTDVEDYKKTYRILINSTDHLVFLSSYRVYAETKTPIKEDSPKLLDVVTEKEFLETEDYAIPKTKCENFLKIECKNQPWTVVRPVISFSDKRLDLLMYGGLQVLEYAEANKELILPESAKNLTAGFDWAKNSGKLIANLLFKPETFGECYTISSAQNLTWGEIADTYSEVTGLKVRWTDEEEFLRDPMFEFQYKVWGYFYDRIYDRKIDNSKVLIATGLKKEDLDSIKEGIKFEINKIKGEK